MNIRLLTREEIHIAFAQGEAAVGESYRRDFAAWRRYLLRTCDAGSGPEASARAIYRAATDGSGRLRYVSGSDTRLALTLRAVLPQRAWDFVVRRLTGVRGRPPAVRVG